MSAEEKPHPASNAGEDRLGKDPSGQDAHNPETEEDTASGGAADD